MKPIKHLLVPKKSVFILAVSWTFLIAYLCLVSSNNLPRVRVPFIDKIVHFLFHFVFTILWSLFFWKQNLNCNYKKVILSILCFSFVFGISIEIAQEFFTVNRRADITDVIANACGALLAGYGLIFFSQKIKKYL